MGPHGRDPLRNRPGKVALVTMMVLLASLTACGGDDSPDPTPTGPVSVSTAATTSTPPPPSTVPLLPPLPTTARALPAATLGPTTSQIVGDQRCQARVPRTWVEESPGVGTTDGGHRFAVSGGPIAADEAWTRAVTLLVDTEGARANATTTAGDTSVRIVIGGDRGFIHRARFDDRYCDLRITARGGPISASERRFWDAVALSLSPVSIGSDATATGATNT